MILESNHYCKIPNCNERISPKLLMCSRHWKQVPSSIQKLVYKNYTAGQEISKMPSPEYEAAAKQAVDSVQSKSLLDSDSFVPKKKEGEL